MVRSLFAMASLTAAVSIASAATPLPQVIDFPPLSDKAPDTSSLTTKTQKCALRAVESITIPNGYTSVHDVNTATDEVRVLKTRTSAFKTGDLNSALVLNLNTQNEHRIEGYSTHDIGVEAKTAKDTNGTVYVHFIARHDGSLDKPDALVGGISIGITPEGKTTKRTGIVAPLDIGLQGEPKKFSHYEWTKQAVQSMEYAFMQCANIENTQRPANAAKEVTTVMPYKAGVSAIELGLIR